MDPDESVLRKTAARCRERGVVIPTIAQLREPSRIPTPIRERLKKVGLWDIDPANLFRITWKNEPVEMGDLYKRGSCIELPAALTGVLALIIGLASKWYHT